MASHQPVLGIDFGTTNSYFSKYLTAPTGQRIRVIDFGNNQMGYISSTILYRKHRKPLVGNSAEQEWGEASASERRDYTIRTHFKPDITSSGEATQDATHFLKAISEHLEERGEVFSPQNHLVIMGIPGNADPVFQNRIKEIAQQAGYGDIKLIFEPIGALLYHLWNKDVSPSETQQGILVIDFGGGTCDFAFMQHLEVCEAWGDMHFGGRLFDDLFFQWFVEQNSSALKKLLKEGNEYFVHWFECRRVKELFSEAMTRDREDKVRFKLGQIKEYGTLKNLTWETFIARARHYQPHRTFLRYLEERQLEFGKRFQDSPVDLIEWFRKILMQGLEKYRIRSGDIRKVILTGGSSQWPFVKDIVCEVLHLTPVHLLTSENPKAAISEGLVILPSVQYRFEQAYHKLKDGTRRFFSDIIEPEIRQRLSGVIAQMLDEILVELYDGKIAPILYEYREKGGSIQSLKQAIFVVCRQSEPFIKTTVAQKLHHLNDALPLLLHQQVCQWFKDHDITYFGQKVSTAQELPELLSTDASPGNERMISGLYDALVNAIGGFVILISTPIIASFTGGTGTALLMSGPMGLIAGAIITILLGYLTLEYGRDKAREIVESIEIPSMILKLLLRDSKIKSILREGKNILEVQLRSEVENSLGEPFHKLRQKILRNIEYEIDSLSIINNL